MPYVPMSAEIVQLPPRYTAEERMKNRIAEWKDTHALLLEQIKRLEAAGFRAQALNFLELVRFVERERIKPLEAM